MSQTTVIVAGKVVSWVDAVAQMDDKLCRQLEYLYPCTEQAFATAYEQAHQQAHGEPFEVH
ncbi:hypothetical protein AhyVDH1_055 [Aeromonas phage AhyVDH1]|nr:hypothetical protein AhyVDH1_055 [Aeromonas phage AhyVDH1]